MLKAEEHQVWLVKSMEWRFACTFYLVHFNRMIKEEPTRANLFRIFYYKISILMVIFNNTYHRPTIYINRSVITHLKVLYISYKWKGTFNKNSFHIWLVSQTILRILYIAAQPKLRCGLIYPQQSCFTFFIFLLSISVLQSSVKLLLFLPFFFLTTLTPLFSCVPTAFDTYHSISSGHA